MSISGPTNSNNTWLVTATPTTSGEESKTLKTAGTFLDRNIIVKTSVAAAKGPSLAITDQSGVNLTPGTLTSGYYPFTTSLTGTMTFSGAGWIATTGAQAKDTDVTVGRLPAATFTTTSGSDGLKVTATAGYVPAGTVGNLSVDSASVKSGTATIGSIATYTYNDTNGDFTVTGTATIPGPFVTSAGYISSTIGTKEANTAYLNATITKIVGRLNVTGIQKVTPKISRGTISISGVTDAASGNATTTAPTGGVYVQVATANLTDTTTVTPEVTTAGYGTATNHGLAKADITVGANASAVTYIPIKIGSATMPATSITANPTIASDVDANNKYVVSVSASKSVTPTVSSGWVASGTAGTVSVNGSLLLDQSTISSTSVTPNTSNTKQTVTVSAGYYPSNRTITINAMPTTSAIRNGNTVSWGSGYIAAGSSTGATTSVTQGTTTFNNAGIVRGEATWGTGWITADSIEPATFANEATENTTYVDISDFAPILTSGGYLYINKGYVDNLTISLAQLVPNDANVNATNQILNGYSAYDKDGNLLVGSIKDTTVSSTYYTTTNSGYGELTGGTYLRNTQYIKAGTASAITGGGLTHGNITTTDTTYLTTTNTGYQVTFSNIASRAAASYSVTAGWIASAGAGLAATGNDTKTASWYIKKGTLVTNTADVTLVTADGTNAGVNIQNTVGTKATTEPTSGYYVAFTGTGSAKVGTAGWIASGTSQSTTSGTKYFPITSAALTVTASGNQGSVSIAAANTAVSGKTLVSVTPTTSSNSIAKYYAEVTATVASSEIALSKGSLTAGYLGASSQITANNITLASKTSSIHYIPLATGALSSTGSSTAIPAASASGFTASSTATSYYVTSTASGTWSSSSGVKTAGYVTNESATSNGTATAGTAVKTYIPAGVLGSGATTINAGSNLTISTTDTSGVSFSASGAVSVTTAGYIPASTSKSSSSATRYVTGVKIAAPSSGTRSFTITVPNGSTTDFIDFVFTVDSTGNVTVAES